MFDLGYLGASESDAITSTAGYFTPSKQFAVLLVTSTSKAHLKLVKSEDDAADDSCFQIQPDTAYKLSMGTDDILSFVCADGEVDGTIWFTLTS